MKKFFAWIGWMIAAVLVALRIFRRGTAEIADVSAEINPAKDQSGVPEQSAIERMQKKFRKGGTILLAVALLSAAVPGRSAPITLDDEEQIIFRDALAAAWEYKGFLTGKAVVRIKSADRESGDVWRVIAVIAIPRQSGEPREIEIPFRVTVRATGSGSGVSWPAAVAIAAAAFAAGIFAGK